MKEIVQLNNQAEVYPSLPRVDGQTGLYCDPSGRFWSTATSLSKNLGINQNTLSNMLSDCEAILGRDKVGRPKTLYPLEIARQQYVSAAP